MPDSPPPHAAAVDEARLIAAPTCSQHIASCYECRRDRARLDWLRRELAGEEPPLNEWRRAAGRWRASDHVAHKEHSDACPPCRAAAADLRRLDREHEQRAMQASAGLVWPQSGSPLPPPALARRAAAAGWRGP